MHDNTPGLTNTTILEILKLVFQQEPASAVLVGGQALAFWVLALEVPVPDELPPTVTRDLDILCSIDTARVVHSRIGGAFCQASADDVTPSLARLTETIDGESIDIDFMKGIIGVRNEALIKKSIVARLVKPDIQVRVMHPYTIWLSRLENLISIKEKRTTYGIAQANLSLAVLKKFAQSKLLGTTHDQDTISWMNHAVIKFKDAKTRDAVIDFELCFSNCFINSNILSAANQKKYNKAKAKIEKLISHAANVKNERIRKTKKCASQDELRASNARELLSEIEKAPPD